MKLVYLIFALIMLFSFSKFVGCSLKSRPSSQSIKIVLEEQSKITSLSSKQFSKNLSSLPTIISDFNCFGINVTGAGIAPAALNQGAGCTSTDNYRGRGLGANSPLGPRGTVFTLDVSAGPSRVIDVYGFYSTSGSCPPTQSSSGYFLGSTTVDLIEDATVTVPVSFTTGALSSIICNGGSGSGSGAVYKNYLYYIGNTANKVTPYTLNDDGTMTLGTALNNVAAPSSLSATPDGKFLYVSSVGNIERYSIATTTGALTFNGVTALGSIVRVAVAPSGTYLLASTSAGPGNVHNYSIDAANNGMLTLNGNFGTGQNMDCIDFHPTSSQAYLGYGTSDGRYYEVNSSTGASGTNAALNFSGTLCASMAVSPNGNHIFVSTTAPNKIFSFLYASGSVPTATTTPLVTGAPLNNPKEMVVDQYNARLYATNTTTNDIVRYNIDGGGNLVAGVTYAPGTETTPISLAFHPNGNYLYVLYSGGVQNIVTFQVNADASLTYLSTRNLTADNAGAPGPVQLKVVRVLQP